VSSVDLVLSPLDDFRASELHYMKDNETGRTFSMHGENEILEADKRRYHFGDLVVDGSSE
jgi:hypothetical protein